ncbi:MAG TPA: hypothetical protein VG015_05400 [Candidatus Dormibacteraeota bacterium]|jgi:hypothetical protein|nr:hypothetical protein [Candidatus Dormibacteraeota bacterium]
MTSITDGLRAVWARARGRYWWVLAALFTAIFLFAKTALKFQGAKLWGPTLIISISAWLAANFADPAGRRRRS